MLQAILQHLKLSPPDTEWPDTERFQDPKIQGRIAGETTLIGAHFPSRRDVLESNYRSSVGEYSPPPELIFQLILEHYSQSLSLVLDADQKITLKSIEERLDQARALRHPEYVLSDLEDYRTERNDFLRLSYSGPLAFTALMFTGAILVVKEIEAAAAAAGQNLILPITDAHVATFCGLSMLAGHMICQALLKGTSDEFRQENPRRRTMRELVQEIDKLAKSSVGPKDYKKAFSATCAKVSEQLTLEALTDFRVLLKEAGISEDMYVEANMTIKRNYLHDGRESIGVRLIEMIRKDFNINTEYQSSSSEPLDELLYAFYNTYGEAAGQELLRGFHQAITDNREKILTETEFLYPTSFHNTSLDSSLVGNVFNHVINEARMYSDGSLRSATLDSILIRLEGMMRIKGEVSEISFPDYLNNKIK